MGIKLLMEKPKLPADQVMEACGIEKNKRNRWAVQKWREKIGFSLNWKKIVELCPDTGTLGGLLVDGFNSKLEEQKARVKELEGKLAESEKKAAEWERDDKEFRQSYFQAENKIKELEKQLEVATKKGHARTDIEKTRELVKE
jgi:hypothetical protein